MVRFGSLAADMGTQIASELGYDFNEEQLEEAMDSVIPSPVAPVSLSDDQAALDYVLQSPHQDYIPADRRRSSAIEMLSPEEMVMLMPSRGPCSASRSMAGVMACGSS